ncbi:19742_t:CDS:2, partial [Gigaspora margarita]
WSADFPQVYEDQPNNILPTEWSMELAHDQTTISLPNIYNNPFIEWSTDFSQDQIIELSTEFTNNPFMEWNANFIQTNSSSLNNYNNSIIKLSAGTTQNNEDPINHNLSIEWTTCFAQDQPNTNLFNTYNAGVTQHYDEQINNLQQQYNSKSIIDDKHPVSFVSRRKKRKESERCKKCNRKRFICDKTSKQCKHCYEASLRVLSGNKLIDDFIKLTQFSYASFTRDSNLEFIPYNRKGNHNVVLKILNDSKKMDSDFLNELKNFFNCKKNIRFSIGRSLQRHYGITQHPETKNYIIVIEFAQNRDLHYFLNKNANTLPLINKLSLLSAISKGLDLVHRPPNRKAYHSLPTKRLENYIGRQGGDLACELKELIDKLGKGEIKFTDNKDTNISSTEKNEQAFYSSRPLTPLISKALTLQSMRLNSNVITVIETNRK